MINLLLSKNARYLLVVMKSRKKLVQTYCYGLNNSLICLQMMKKGIIRL